jgi:cbb3-type cytochrome oxidase subunit 3
MDYEAFRALNDFWMPRFAFLALLGVYLIILGIGLAGLVTALRKRERERVEHTSASTLNGSK